MDMWINECKYNVYSYDAYNKIVMLVICVYLSLIKYLEDVENVQKKKKEKKINDILKSLLYGGCSFQSPLYRIAELFLAQQCGLSKKTTL